MSYNKGSKDNHLNEAYLTDYLQSCFNEALQKHIGTTDLEAVEKTIREQLEKVYNQKLITNDFKVGIVTQLWNTWSLKKKLKWYFHNRFPIVRDMSEQIRRQIDDYNNLVYETNELRLNELGDGSYVPVYPKEYPEHLNPCPKSIVIVDSKVKLNLPMDFINIDINLGEK